MIAGLVLAAGSGRRFGGAKQLAPFRGRPLLEHALTAVARSPVGERLVILGAEAGTILEGVELSGFRPILCHDWERGQASSLRAGVLAAAETGAEAVVVVLGDQPLISPAAIERLIEARRSEATALQATYGGRAGHPALFERVLFDRIVGLSGDTGARGLLGGPGYLAVPCDGLGSPVDVDTPEQLARLERSVADRPHG